MAYDALENFFLSMDIEDISTIGLQDNTFSSPAPLRRRITLVDDLDKNGERPFSASVDASVCSQQ